MGILKEFLDGQVDLLPSRIAKVEAKRDEWVNAVDGLIARIKGWIEQEDPKRILAVEEYVVPIREEGIGNYEAHGLLIKLGPREVRVEPVARFVLGPTTTTAPGRNPFALSYGRVDLKNRLAKFFIDRIQKDPGDLWSIADQDGFHRRSFDQQSFEAALKSLLE